MPKYFLIIGISINPPSYERIQSDPISGLHQRPDNISIPSTPSSSSSSFISSSYPTPVSEEVPQEVRYPPSFQCSPHFADLEWSLHDRRAVEPLAAESLPLSVPVRSSLSAQVLCMEGLQKEGVHLAGMLGQERG